MTARLCRVAGVAAAAALCLSALSASPASATEEPTAPAPCTLSEAGVQAAQDDIALLTKQLAGTKPTALERRAIVAAIAELERTARGLKLTAEQRVAKRAERETLKAALKASTDAEQRAAMRAELLALREALEPGRLTRDEKRALQAKRNELKRSLQREKPSRADTAVAKDRLKTLRRALEPCLGNEL